MRQLVCVVEYHCAPSSSSLTSIPDFIQARKVLELLVWAAVSQEPFRFGEPSCFVWSASTSGPSGRERAAGCRRLGKAKIVRFDVPVVLVLTRSYQTAPAGRSEWEVFEILSFNNELPARQQNSRSSSSTGGGRFEALSAKRNMTEDHKKTNIEKISKDCERCGEHRLSFGGVLQEQGLHLQYSLSSTKSLAARGLACMTRPHRTSLSPLPAHI